MLLYQKLSEAYAVLSHKEYRVQYDEGSWGNGIMFPSLLCSLTFVFLSFSLIFSSQLQIPEIWRSR